jgi:hypothetical protein
MSMNNNGNVSKQPIVDKNGVVSSRFKKMDTGTSAASAALASRSPIGGTVSRLPENINWDDVSPQHARRLGAMAIAGIDDPDKFWSNIDFFKGMLESNKSGVAIEMIADYKVPKHLSDAWMKSYEMDQDDATSFLRATDEEMDQFGAALADFNMAIRLADPHSGLSSPAPDMDSVEGMSKKDKFFFGLGNVIGKMAENPRGDRLMDKIDKIFGLSKDIDLERDKK